MSATTKAFQIDLHEGKKEFQNCNPFYSKDINSHDFLISELNIKLMLASQECMFVLLHFLNN